MKSPRGAKRILEIGNWPPPLCAFSMSLVGLRRVLEARGWECRVMNINENRRVRSPEYIDVQNPWDYVVKISRSVWDGCAVHVRAIGMSSKKGYLAALVPLLLARLGRRPALLTYGGGHRQTDLPAPPLSFRRLALTFLFRLATRVYCNSEAVKQVLLSTAIPAERVMANPHISPYYVEFTPVALPQGVEDYYDRHDGVFFIYACFRPEFALELLAEAIRRFRISFPKIGFLLVSPWERERRPMREFLRKEKIEEAVYLEGAVSHEVFLTLLSRSLAYIRTPWTDGVCASVLESMKLKVPVLAADNGDRPPGVRLWPMGDVESLLGLMTEAVRSRAEMAAQIPEVVVEDNVEKLADSIEEVWLSSIPRPQPQPASRLAP
jgi:glycosyltransferase involved in cell wall biosynthesis